MTTRRKSTSAVSLDFSGAADIDPERVSEMESFLRYAFPGSRRGKKVKVAISKPGDKTTFRAWLVALDAPNVFMDLLKRSETHNVFIGSALFKPSSLSSRAEDVLSSRVVWVDLDPPHLAEEDSRGNKVIDITKIQDHLEKVKAFTAEWKKLGARVTMSGSRGARHVRFRVNRDLTPGETRALNWLAAERYDGDRKFSPEAVLRLPGTRNHKSARARDVKALKRTLGTIWDPSELARALGWEDSFEALAQEMSAQTYNGAEDYEGEEVDLNSPQYRAVLKSLEYINEKFEDGDYPKRHKATWGIVKDCMAANMNVEQAIYVANQSSPLRSKSEEERGFSIARDTHRVWNKVVSESRGKTALAIVQGGGSPEAEANSLIAPQLPETFWAARGTLNKIRRAGWAMRVNPDLLLMATMFQASGLTDPALTVDTGIPGKPPVVFNVIVAPIGDPGDGKTTSVHAAKEILPAQTAEQPHTYLNTLTGEIVTEQTPVEPELEPLGTGEGLIEAYMGMVAVATDKTNKDGDPVFKMEKRQTQNSVLFMADEGESILKKATRKEDITLSTIRTVFSGGTAGQKNAGVETTRKLKGGTYRCSIFIGFQPIKAAPILEDSEGGTPQRFTFVAVTGGRFPAREVKVPMPKPLSGFIQSYGVVHPLRGFQLAASVQDEIDLWDHNRVTGNRSEFERGRDAHKVAHLVKYAQFLALLEAKRRIDSDGIVEITEEDWELAKVMRANSLAVEDWVLSKSQDAKAKEWKAKKAAAIELHTAKESAADDNRGRRLARSARTLSIKIWAAAEPQTRGMIRRVMKADLRPQVDEFIQYAVEEEWIESAGKKDLYRPGKTNPQEK